MRNTLFTVAVIILSLTSCESGKNDNGILLKIGEKLEYRIDDIELYDTSTHMLYFKNNHPEFDSITQSSFTFLANGEEIYSGVFWPAYYSSLPSVPYIRSQSSFYHNYVLRINYSNPLNPDLRNDSRLITAFKDHSLLHSGLSVSIDSIKAIPTQLTFSFTITNNDQSALLIIDPDKTGINLFHYFTIGLVIRKSNYSEVFSPDVEYTIPDDPGSWKPEWLSQINSGESVHFNLSYSVITPISAGEYQALFTFPGLAFQVKREELYRENSRIWLGDIKAIKTITIE